jgi:transcriptional regulator GlxA family with amidase domain
MDQRIGLVLTRITDNLNQELLLDELACSVSLSSSRFHNLFKVETGTSPARYLRDLRFTRAKEMLEGSLLSVKQIMAAVGITDRSHFDRQFKKAYGVTPVQYRRNSYNCQSVGGPAPRARETAIR